MSDSRLEKFIYAICSMDVTDLPVPLSRIEKLWNCLITGETPNFEPLSRNEKYLMAMLDRYDISNLPAPMSRGEKLLYKIAVGETDLSDVPGYLSRYEELLKYLIENGGISGGDFEYVLYTINQSLYTLYTTAEKPVKSAILKGNTLVNLIDNGSKRKQITYTVATKANYQFNKDMLVANKTYLLLFTVTDFSGDAFHVSFNKSNQYGVTYLTNVKNGLFKAKVNFSDLTSVTDTLIIYKLSGTALGGYVEKVMLIEYQDGMENWDIPYFEGMQSVKLSVLTTTGKNLFDDATQSTNITINLDNGLVDVKTNDRNTSDFINVVSGKIYKSNTTMTRIALYNNGSFVRSVVNTPSIQINSNENQLRFSYNNSLTNIQLEEGSVVTSYEPYKSNILTVNEPVELRGIGDAQDTLDCFTGEVTEYFDEVIFDGSDDERFVYLDVYSSDDIALFEYRNYFDYNISALNRNGNMMCDKFNVNSNYLYPTKEGVYCQYKHLNVMIEKSKLLEMTPSGFNAYLNQNPIKMIIPKQKSIKTVDLTTVDQDNQPTQLGTFENITHVSLEAENLIPTVEMEVATRISTELASASPLMDDISTKQEQLNTMVDEQSNNIDATMIATTEIYEETL
ncbi:MAG: hypothetical protein PUD99_09480 [Turicibacter sp.]|nr:hypothetical protein [Turicibacter sp.]